MSLELVIAENNPSDCDATPNNMIHTGTTWAGRNIALQSDFPEAVMVPVLWIPLAQKVGRSTCQCEAKIQLKQELSFYS